MILSLWMFFLLFLPHHLFLFCSTLFHLFSVTVTPLPLPSIIHFSLAVSLPLSLSFSLIIIKQWFTHLGSNCICWSVLSLRCPQSKVFWRSSHDLQTAINLYWPKLLHLISHYYILSSIQNRSMVQPFWPPSQCFSSPTSPLSPQTKKFSGQKTSAVL